MDRNLPSASWIHSRSVFPLFIAWWNVDRSDAGGAGVAWRNADWSDAGGAGAACRSGGLGVGCDAGGPGVGCGDGGLGVGTGGAALSLAIRLSYSSTIFLLRPSMILEYVNKAYI